MNDDKKFAPETPADVLHTHVQNHIQLPEASKFDNEELMDEVSEHPNLSSESITALYNHGFEHVDHSQAPLGLNEMGNMSHQTFNNLLKHPNMPVELKTDFLRKTYHPDNAHSQMHEDLADKGHVPEAELRQMSDSVLMQGGDPHSYSQISPDYYLNYLNKNKDVQTDGMPEEQKDAVERELSMAKNGLEHSQKHNEGTLNATTDVLSKIDPHYLKDIVNSQSGMSKDHLNRLHQFAEANHNDDNDFSDLKESIIKHANVDPTLLAKAVNEKDLAETALAHPNLPKEALNAAVKKIKDTSSWESRRHINAILENPNVTKAHVKALVAKGSKAALEHNMADEEDVRNVWNKSDKGLEAARSILSAKNVPPDVLKEIVNHKNQEVAVKALNHDKSDMSVVQEGLKRKAKGVQDEARLHPLVAAQQVKEGLTSGKVSLTKIYQDHDYKKHFDQMPTDDQQKVFHAAHEKYKGSDLEKAAKDSKERTENVIYNKFQLAADKRVPEQIREQHGKDLADMFGDKVPKNNVLNENTRLNILHDDHKSDNGRLIRAVASLAANGNTDAQKAFLDNPAILSDAHGHLPLKEVPGNFLESMYRKGQEYRQNGTTVYDHNGNPKPFDEHGLMLSSVFESPNLPENAFQEIATNPELMEKIGQGEQFDRYNDLPEAEQNQKYAEILQSGSQEAAKSILKSKAPQQSWDAAFTKLNPAEKSKFVENNIQRIQNHRPDVLRKAALGAFNTEVSEMSQRRAIANLNPQRIEDVQAAKQAISIPTDAPGHVTDEQMADSLPKQMIAQDFSLSDHAFSANRPELGYNLLAKHFIRKTDNLPSSYYRSTESEKLATKAATDHLVSEMQAKIQTAPQISDVTSDNPIASNWASLINQGQNSYGGNSTFLNNLKGKGANFDFLTDFPGQAGDELKKLALQHDLVSDEKVEALAQSGTMQDIIGIGNAAKRRQMLSVFLNKPDIKSSDIQALASRLDSGYLNAEADARTRRSMSPDTQQEFSKKLHRIIDVAATVSPSSITSIISKAFNPSTKGRELTNDDTNRIVKDLHKHIMTQTFPTDNAKNQALYGMIKGLNGAGLEQNHLKKTLESQVIKSSDLDTMVEMAERGDLSDKGTAVLSKLAAQPDVLNASQIAGLAHTLNSSSSAESVIGMTRAFEQKIAENPQTSPALKNKFLANISNTFNPYETNESDAKRNDFVINYNRKATLDPQTAPRANSNLKKISTNLANQDLDKALDIYTSLPDDPTQFEEKVSGGGDLADAMVNHPRFIENAQQGWKLEQFASNAADLTGQNASILTNRALTSPTPLNKSNLMSRFEINSFVQPEDSIKLARSMSENDFNHWTKLNRDNSLEGNLVFSAHARLADLQEVMKNPNLAAPGAPFMGDEHRNKIAYNLHALSHVVLNARFADDISLLKDKLTKVSEIIHQIHDNSMHLVTSMMSDLKKTGYTEEIGRDMSYVLNIADNLASTKISLGREDSLKILEMTNGHRNLASAAGKDTKADSYRVISKVVKKAEDLEDQDWKQVFSTEPAAVFGLSSRENIPSEALNNIDFKFYENTRDSDIEERSGSQTTQEFFAKESSQWFGSLSKDDLAHHGKNLMDMYVRMTDAGTISGNTYTKAMSAALEHMGQVMDHKDVSRLLEQTKQHDIKETIFKQAVENGVGGEQTLKQYTKAYGDELFRNVTDFKKYQGDEIKAKLGPVITSPHINDDIGLKVNEMFDQNPDAMKYSMQEMLKNKSTPTKTINEFAEKLMKNHKNGYKAFDQRMSADLAKEILSHPNLEESSVVDMFNTTQEQYPKFFASSGKFNPALTNPTHGGKLFRSIPVVVPKDVPNVETASVVKNVSLQHKSYKRMQDVMNLIPAEGISWADFKRKHPSEEKTLPQEVKSVFMSANNKPVMPEDFAKGLRSLDDASKKYHLTYSHWTSDLQKHRRKSAPNLVVQVNNSEESEKTLSQDPKLWSLYQKLLQETNGISGDTIGLHPTTPHLVSWSRVDTDQGGKAWVIEEHQSDFAQKFRKNLKTILKNFPSGAKINGHHITAEDMAGYAKTIDKHLEDWSEASIQAVIDNAKAHGITKLFMHGPELRSHMSGRSRNFEYNRESWDNKNTRGQMAGFRKIYEETPVKHGFKECDYTDYPEYSNETLNAVTKKGLSTKCWMLDLAEPKRKKRA